VKAAEARAAHLEKNHKPPRTVKMAPELFKETWLRRPTEEVEIGLRGADVEELQRAHAEATRKADVDHSGKLSHDDPMWHVSYDGYLQALVIGTVITDPDDVRQPFWAFQGDPGYVMGCLKPKGIERLYDELEFLVVTTSPGRAEASDEEIAQFGAAMVSGDLFDLIDVSDAPEAYRDARRAGVERQVRRLVAYARDLILDPAARPNLDS
jgi:hypothetical protein